MTLRSRTQLKTHPEGSKLKILLGGLLHSLMALRLQGLSQPVKRWQHHINHTFLYTPSDVRPCSHTCTDAYTQKQTVQFAASASWSRAHLFWSSDSYFHLKPDCESKRARKTFNIALYKLQQKTIWATLTCWAEWIFHFFKWNIRFKIWAEISTCRLQTLTSVVRQGRTGWLLLSVPAPTSRLIKKVVFQAGLQMGHMWPEHM